MKEHKQSLYELFSQFYWFIARQRHFNHFHNLSSISNPYRGQGRILKILKLKPEMSQKELSELLDIRAQSLGELLRKLEQNGYLTRVTSETDKRAMIIKLTDKGLNAEIGDDRQNGYDRIFKCLSEEEQETLANLLERLINNLHISASLTQEQNSHMKQSSHHRHAHRRRHHITRYHLDDEKTT